MTVSPSSQIYLCTTPLQNDYKNQLTFSSLETQYNYFLSTVNFTVDNYTYIKHDNSLKIGINIDEIINCNYLFYKNTGFTNKYYYCFITNMTYINENCTLISFETDVFQTWYFNIKFNACFVEREHVSNDTIGLHTVPENVELGEYISNGFIRDNELNDLSYIVQVTEWISGSDDKPLTTNFGGVSAPGGAYICSSNSQVANIVQAYQDGRENAVFNVYLVPSKIINNSSGTSQYSGQSSPVTYNINIDKQYTLDNYTPKNNKLLTYPYQYLILDNNNGTSNILQYELFSTSTCNFEVAGVPVVGGSIKCVPLNYKNESRFQQEGLMSGKFPTCGWVNDTYTNWLTQNAVNIGLGITSSGLSLASGVAMLNSLPTLMTGASTILNSSMNIASTIGQIYQHSLIPNSNQGNVNGGDINTCYHMNKFYFIKMSIKKEYAQIIDNYFNMFGYKVNTVKHPNLTGRQNWNYVKTINCTFSGNIPQEDLNIIRQSFNNGITLWHNPATIFNYNNSNDING